MRKKSSISEKFTIKNAILVFALQSKKGTTTTTSTSWTVLVLNRLFSCAHGVQKKHCGIEWYVARHSKMVLRTHEISICASAKSDLRARLSSTLWNWFILTHQRIMYLSNQTALMCRLIWSYTFHICPKTPFRMTRIILSCLLTVFIGTSMNARIKTVR